MENHNSRRTFLTTVTLGVAPLFAAPFIKMQGALAALVSMNDPLVKALGYFNVAEAEVAAKGKGAGADQAKASLKARTDKKAFCSTCNFYQGDAKSKTAKCTLITSGDVASTGWCRSWSAKQVQKKA